MKTFCQGGGGPAEPTAERHPQSDPGEKLTIAIEQSVLTDDVKSNAKGGEPSGFTMAEILLSLTIIGVVAAITLPSLTGNINERTWNAQRKALYARMSQAIALMPALNGYGTLTEETDSAGSTSIEDTAAETFITAGLAKVLKINNICDNEHLEDCGIPSKIVNLGGTSTISTPKKLSELNILNVKVSYSDSYDRSTSMSLIDSKAAAFETQNGESILVYYNPVCRGSLQDAEMVFHSQMMCANFVYDLNGSKGPNTVGKDIGFISAFYPSDVQVVAPMPYVRDADGTYAHKDAGKACTSLDSEYRLPNITELASISTNKALVGNLPQWIYWSSDTISSTKAWYFSMQVGFANVWQNRNSSWAVRCVKR